MSYADDREYTKAEAAVELCKYVLTHGHKPDWSFTVRDAMRVTGRGYMFTVRLLAELDRVLGTYVDEHSGRAKNGRWKIMRRKVLCDE